MNFDIIYARKLYTKYLLKYQVLKLFVHFCTKKYSTRRALGRFGDEVIRVKSGDNKDRFYEGKNFREFEAMSHGVAFLRVRVYERPGRRVC